MIRIKTKRRCAVSGLPIFRVITRTPTGRIITYHTDIA